MANFGTFWHPFANLWHILATFGNFWLSLETFNNFMHLWGNFGIFLATFGHTRKLLGTHDLFTSLVIFWPLLATFANVSYFWQSLPFFGLSCNHVTMSSSHLITLSAFQLAHLGACFNPFLRIRQHNFFNMGLGGGGVLSVFFKFCQIKAP